MEYQIGQRVEVLDTAIRKARWRKGTIIGKYDTPVDHYEVKIDRGLFGVFKKDYIRHDPGPMMPITFPRKSVFYGARHSDGKEIEITLLAYPERKDRGRDLWRATTELLIDGDMCVSKTLSSSLEPIERTKERYQNDIALMEAKGINTKTIFPP